MTTWLTPGRPSHKLVATNQKGSFLKGHPPGPGAWANLAVELSQTIFYFLQNFHKLATLRSMFYSIPYEPRKLQATEGRLEKIYAAAKLGLKGDALALAAGMLPSEYRQLTQFDPIAEMAELKGRADGEREMSEVLHEAARNGDAKAALEILKHQHGWVAKQQINVEVDQRISITQALEDAQKRVLDAIDVTPKENDSQYQPTLHVEQQQKAA